MHRDRPVVGLVAVIETSHDTAPAGSKYFAFGLEEVRGLTVCDRDQRSSCSPPGWRWPPVPISTPSVSTVHMFFGGPPQYGSVA